MENFQLLFAEKWQTTDKTFLFIPLNKNIGSIKAIFNNILILNMNLEKW